MNWHKEPLGIRATRHSGVKYVGPILLINNRDRLSVMSFEYHAIKGINSQHRGIEDVMLRCLERGDYLIEDDNPAISLYARKDMGLEEIINRELDAWLLRDIEVDEYVSKMEKLNEHYKKT